MSIMEDSFVLLSTMSPKIDKAKKVGTKTVTKLSLKKQIRRSSIYNKIPCFRGNNVICIVSTSSEEVSSNDDVITKNQNSVIIVESSDAESVSDNISYRTANSVVSESDIDGNNVIQTFKDPNCSSDKSDKPRQNYTTCFEESEKRNSINDLVQKYLQNDMIDKQEKNLSASIQLEYDGNTLFGEFSRILKFEEIEGKKSVEGNNSFKTLDIREDYFERNEADLAKKVTSSPHFESSKNSNYVNDLVQKYLQDDVVDDQDKRVPSINNSDHINGNHEFSTVSTFEEAQEKISITENEKNLGSFNNSFKTSDVQEDAVIKDSFEDDEANLAYKVTSSPHFESSKNPNSVNHLVQKYLQDDVVEKKEKGVSSFVQKWLETLDRNVENVDYIKRNHEFSRLFTFEEVEEQKFVIEDDKLNVQNKNNLDRSLNNSFSSLSIQENKVAEDSAEENEPDNCPATPILLNDQENLLNELYGTSWRESQEKPLPKTEEKLRHKFLLPDINKCRTETKRKISMTHKNPYVDSEKKKFNLLRTLQCARFRVNIESPWANQLKNLCDSDTTSSDKENYQDGEFKKRLDFSDCDDEDLKINNVNSMKSPLIDRNKNYKGIKEKKNEEEIKPVRKKKLSKSKPKYEVSSSSDISGSEDSDYSNDKHLKTKKVLTKPNLPKSTGICSFLVSLSLSVPVTSCNPAARIYRESFKTQKEELAKKLFTMFNENIFEDRLPNDMLLEWNDKMRRTAGYCYCRKITRRTGIVERNARIVLSTKVVDTADRLRDTLVHEMCHAATWIVNEISDGHGPFWKSWSVKAMKAYPDLPPIKRCHDYHINTKYTYKCMDCGYSIGRHSKSLDIERKRCGYCHGKFEVFINKITKNGVKSVPATPKKPSAFADFVKQNYKTVKTESLKHGEVMKILSKQFKEIKLDNK